MTVLLYDYHELEERSSSNLRVWKACHTTLYVLAVLFGILNFIFLENTVQLVDDNCILSPRNLVFHWVELPNTPNETLYNETVNKTDGPTNTTTSDAIKSEETKNATKSEKPVKETEVNTESATEFEQATNKPDDNAQNKTDPDSNGTVNKQKTKRETPSSNLVNGDVNDQNATVISDRKVLMLDTSKTFFGKQSDCQFAQYMPVMSTVIASVWVTLFIMCPSGGRTRTGLQQPYRILAPALLTAVVMVGLTGHSFTTTNGGLQDFCAAFINQTNTTACSAVNPYLERGWNSSWGLSRYASATRAASAGVWACWACATALLLARCIAAPDFTLRRTTAYLVDPQKKIIPQMKKAQRERRSQRSANCSPSKRDTISVKSEPTITTELVTASIEHGSESAPTSLNVTPIKTRDGEAIELRHTPRSDDQR